MAEVFEEFTQKEMKRDPKTRIAYPQYWNPIIGDWEILQGSGGSFNAQYRSLVVKDSFGGGGNLTKEFAEPMAALVISNDGESDLSFTIHGMTFVVKGGEVFEADFDDFTTVSIVASAPFRAYAKKAIGAVSVVQPPPADTTAPDNVTDLRATSVTVNSVELAWTASMAEDVAGYDIYRGVTLIGSTAGTSYSADGLDENTQYTFTVKAKDFAGNVASGTAVTITTGLGEDTTAPADVTGLSVSNVTHASLTLSWVASVSSDVASYEVFNGSSLITTVTGTTYNVTGLTAATAYTFTVKARDGAGNVSAGVSVSETTAEAPAEGDTTPPTVTASPNGGTFTEAQTVTLTADEPATIYYTTDGTEPSVSSSVYSAPITISETMTLKYFGVDSSGNESAVQTAEFTISDEVIPPIQEVVYVDGDYLVAPVSTFVASISTSFTDETYTTVQLKLRKTLFDEDDFTQLLSVNGLSYVVYSSFSGAPEHSYTANTAANDNNLFIRVPNSAGTTVSDVVNYLQTTFGDLRVKLSASYQIMTIPSNVTNVTSRATTLAGSEYFICTLSGETLPVWENTRYMFSSLGYEVQATYPWSYDKFCMKLEADNRFSMLLPAGTLSSIDAAGVNEYLSSANIKIFY